MAKDFYLYGDPTMDQPTIAACFNEVDRLIEIAASQLDCRLWHEALLSIKEALRHIAKTLRDWVCDDQLQSIGCMLGFLWSNAQLSWDDNELLVRVRWLHSMCS